MATKRDYYAILGVSKDADFETIKKSYRELALKYHPDRAPVNKKQEAEENFKEVSEAYAILSDPQKKTLYDQYGHAGIDQKYAYEDIFKGTDFNSVFQDLSGFGFGEGLFDRFFGGFGFDLFGRHQERSTRSDDLQTSIKITLEEAATGVEKRLQVSERISCKRCLGSGATPGTKKERCSHCQGSGNISSLQGVIHFIQSCPYCHGSGVVIKTPCQECQGKGQVDAMRSLKVFIPPGVDMGTQLRIAKEGREKKGDLYLTIEIKPHKFLERNGEDLLAKVEIPFTTAILGGEIRVPTLSNEVLMKIPSGTQNGKVFRLKGKGMPRSHTQQTGDELVLVHVQIPTSLTKEQRMLIEAFEKTLKTI